MEDSQEKFFVELAKTKTTPTPSPLKIETDKEPAIAEEEGEGQLTVDVYQDGDDIVVQSAVAGVNPDELEINITNESVTIRGKRERTEKVEEKDYFYQECFWGKFSRSIILPQEVDPEKSTATLKNGVLTIRMPKLDRKKAKKLKVKFD
jgi:HSP20 family protein